jgi:hypothetical protein
MTTNGAPAAVRMYVQIDAELAQAMDRDRRDKRMSRPQYLRSTLAAALIAAGELVPSIREASQ